MIKQVPAGFTLQELRAYLDGGDRTEVPEGYRTAREWADVFDIHVYTMRVVLQQARNAGKLSCRYDRRERIDGKIMWIPVYAFMLDGAGEGRESGA